MTDQIYVGVDVAKNWLDIHHASGKPGAVRYNGVRQHSSLGYLTPAAFAVRVARIAPRDATGRDAAVVGLGAPARCITAPPRAIATSRGRSLKLTMARRSRVDHTP